MKELEGIIEFVRPLKNVNPAWLYFVIIYHDAEWLRKMLLLEHVDVQPLLTFHDLSKEGEIAKRFEQEHLVFALYRERTEIQYIVRKIKRVMLLNHNGYC